MSVTTGLSWQPTPNDSWIMSRLNHSSPTPSIQNQASRFIDKTEIMSITAQMSGQFIYGHRRIGYLATALNFTTAYICNGNGYEIRMDIQSNKSDHSFHGDSPP